MSGALEFARNAKSGRVHILADAGHDGCEVVTGIITNAEEFVDALLAKTRMLCGAQLWTGPMEHYHAIYVAGDDFADEELCLGCVRALGGESWRAFHVDNRGAS